MRVISALFIACTVAFSFLWSNPASATSVTNLNTGTLLFFDDYESNTNVDPTAHVAGGGGDSLYNPDNASTGTWLESAAEPAIVEVTSYGTPGPNEGSNYLRAVREPLTEGGNSPFPSATMGLTAVQSAVGDVIRYETAQNIMVGLSSGAGDLGSRTFLLREMDVSEGVDGPSFINVEMHADGLIYNRLSSGPVATTMAYTPGVWQNFAVEYEIGADTYTLELNGVRLSGLPTFDGVGHNNVGEGVVGGGNPNSVPNGTYQYYDALSEFAPAPVLEIDRSSRNAILSNDTGAPIQFVGYSMTSALGAFDQGGWITISEHYDDSSNGGNESVDDDDPWTVLTAEDAHGDLSEIEFNGGNGGSIAHGNTIDFGAPWIKNMVESGDVRMQLLLDDGTILDATVLFVGGSGDPYPRSDLNYDSVITPADWLIYVDGLERDLSSLSPAQAYQKGDLNYDGSNDDLDFLLFRSDYEAANGAGSFAAMLASVPEPSSGLLLLLGGLGWLGAKRRGSCK